MKKHLSALLGSTALIAAAIASPPFATTSSAQSLSACGVDHGFICNTASVTICSTPWLPGCLISITYTTAMYQSYVY